MESRRDFNKGDLIWAKMKNYPFWPAKIASPPTIKEKTTKQMQKKNTSTLRKSRHFVYFFGTENYAWISGENIVPHSEEMLNKVSKKKNSLYSKAVDKIIEESSLIEIMKKKIGFIGLAEEGHRIVKSLLIKGFNVSVWTQTSENCKESVDAGAHPFSSPADLLLHCDIIFCLLSGAEAVKSIVLGKGGILQAFEKSRIQNKGYVELSALDLDTLIETATAITGKGLKYLAAPLHGPCVDETSQFLRCGGDIELFHTCSRYFSVMCSMCLHTNCGLKSIFG